MLPPDVAYILGLILGGLLGIWLGVRLSSFSLIRKAKMAGKLEELDELLKQILAG